MASLAPQLRKAALRFEEVETQLAQPETYADPDLVAKLNREQKDLAPLVEAWQQYEKVQQDLAGLAELLEDPEYRPLAQAEQAQAQQELARMDQAQVDRIVRAIADAGVRNARRLAQMANEDTGFGIVDDKVIKNIFASRGVYEHIKDMKTIGEISRDDAKRLRTIAVPVGVIAGLIPSTNPTSTALYKAEIAIKAGNAIVFSPHPTALRCILETVKVIRQAVAEAGGNENLVSCITIPTMEATDNLMRHRDVAMILATGGSAMVRAA